MLVRDSVDNLIIEKPFTKTSDNRGNIGLDVDTRTHYFVGIECTYRTLPHVYNMMFYATVLDNNLERAANTSVSGVCYLIKKP